MSFSWCHRRVKQQWVVLENGCLENFKVPNGETETPRLPTDYGEMLPKGATSQLEINFILKLVTILVGRNLRANQVIDGYV